MISNNNKYQNDPPESDIKFILKLFNSNKFIDAKKEIDKQIIKKVIIFDVFEGKKLPENKKSIALKVILQPLEKTFTDSEIEKISTNIIDLISKSFGGELRH